MIKICKKNKQNKGYAILELLFYITLFSILSLVVIDAMIIMTKSFKEVTRQAELTRSGNIMERISREVRSSYDINTISANNLKLNTKDSGGADKTIEFLLSGSDIRLLENDILTGNLNASDVTISDLAFTQITTPKGKAVKIFFTVKSASDTLNRTQDFYNTIVLRGNYQ